LKKQVKKMLKLSARKFKKAPPGTNVLVKIAEVDRSRIAPRNELAVVREYDKERQLYKLGTASCNDDCLKLI
jgi:hypothetical protein